MRKASYGSSTATTTNFQAAFIVDPNGYGTNGATTTNGDPQTQPVDGTIFGPTSNTPPVGNLSGGANNTDTITNANTIVATRNETFGNASGDINSDGFASGPAAPTSQINVPTGSTMGMGGGGPSGGTVSWNTGDEVQTIWIGESCPGCAISGGMMGGGGSSGVFSFHQYENLTTGAMAATRSIRSSAPFAWTTTPFGTEPSL